MDLLIQMLRINVTQQNFTQNKHKIIQIFRLLHFNCYLDLALNFISKLQTLINSLHFQFVP
jgi:hypothetical protein